MAAQSAFTPGATITVTGFTASVPTALPLPRGGAQVRVASPVANTVTAFMKFGDSTVTATASDTPILPQSVELFTVPSNATHVAFFAGSASTVHLTSGYGV